jgi:hypothetical protein
LVVPQRVFRARELMPLSVERLFGRLQVGPIALDLAGVAMRHVLPKLRQVFLHRATVLLHLLPIVLYVLPILADVRAVVVQVMPVLVCVMPIVARVVERMARRETGQGVLRRAVRRLSRIRLRSGVRMTGRVRALGRAGMVRPVTRTLERVTVRVTGVMSAATAAEMCGRAWTTSAVSATASAAMAPAMSVGTTRPSR